MAAIPRSVTSTSRRVYYDARLAQGMKHKSALCALKRRVSDNVYAHLINDARRAEKRSGPGRANGERLCLQRGRLTPPNNQLFE